LKAANNQLLYEELRQKYQTFEYQNYSFNINDNNLEAKFLFKIGNSIAFQPGIKIPTRNFYNFNELSIAKLNNLIFHIGMVELISYWKAACPPRLIIKPHKLNKEQIDFWKKLYFNGLGEFFYLNGINTSDEEFMNIESEGEPIEKFSINIDETRVMIPVGGGKDSVVSLELLKESSHKIIPMAMNPREAVVRTIEKAEFSMDESIVVNRSLDIKLLELNKKGFLNGHTPFSALLAFVTSLTAVMAGIKFIALSNESSANESTVPGSKINHQYSKSFEFEQDFNRYLSKFVTPDVHYFSFLRPLNELQIGALFSRFTQHHYSFRSCNVGSKTDSWCGHCPKCLFTRIILGPFMETDKLNTIFGKELLDDDSLKTVFDELTGNADIKPFECVGTTDEVNAALGFITNRWSGKLPALLNSHYTNRQGEAELTALLKEYNTENNLPPEYSSILKNSLRKIALG